MAAIGSEHFCELNNKTLYYISPLYMLDTLKSFVLSLLFFQFINCTILLHYIILEIIYHKTILQSQPKKSVLYLDSYI